MACQNIDEGGDGAAFEPAVAGYPSLKTVPPRPQLSYPVQQRRTIVEGLIADLENARYTSQVVRFRTGRSNLPPPPEPERMPAALAEAIVGPERAATEQTAATVAPGAVIDDAPLYFGGGDDDDGSLSDFVRDMVRETAPQPVAPLGIPEPPPASEPLAPEPADAPPTSMEDAPPGEAAPAASPVDAPAPTEPPAEATAAAPKSTTTAPGATLAAHGDAALRRADAPASESVAGTQGRAAPVPRLRPELPPVAAVNAPLPAPRPVPPEAFATEVALAAPPDPPAAGNTAAGPREEASTPQVQAGLVAFAPGSAHLAMAAEPELARLLADAQRDGLLIDIIGEAKEPALALDRARAVALALIKLGAGTERLRIGSDPEPSGDRAWIILADPL